MLEEDEAMILKFNGQSLNYKMLKSIKDETDRRVKTNIGWQNLIPFESTQRIYTSVTDDPHMHTKKEREP